MALEPLPAVEWAVSRQVVDYQTAVAAMEARVAAICEGRAGELIWLLEHEALYTAGTSAQPADLIEPDRFPVHQTGRGGQYTYHGPGQRVVYVMVDVRHRFNGDVRRFVEFLENVIISTLGRFGICGEIRSGRVGVWVARPDLGAEHEDKIAAIGIRIRHGISFHGLAINVAPDLGHFSGIVPCGILEHGVTSFADLGLDAGLADLDVALRSEFERQFGQMTNAEPLVPEPA